MLLTVTRPVAADGLDPVPPCEDKRWQSNHSVCHGWMEDCNFWQPLTRTTQDTHATLNLDYNLKRRGKLARVL